MLNAKRAKKSEALIFAKKKCLCLNWLVVAVTAGMAIAADSGQQFKVGDFVIAQRFGKPYKAKVLRVESGRYLIRFPHWEDGSYKDDPGAADSMYQASEVQAVPVEAPQGTAAAAPASAIPSLPIPAAIAQQPSGLPSKVPATAPGATAGADAEPLTKQEIIAWLQPRKLNALDYAQKQKLSDQLIELIKRRGVAAKYDSADGSDYANAGGALVIEAIKANTGAPVNLDWLFGEWTMSVFTDSGFTPSTSQEVQNGSLSIFEKDHEYIWQVYNSDKAKDWVKGTWREATPEEMGHVGGAGVVLQKGPHGMDWIAYKYRAADTATLLVADLKTRRERQYGTRGQ